MKTLFKNQDDVQNMSLVKDGAYLTDSLSLESANALLERDSFLDSSEELQILHLASVAQIVELICLSEQIIVDDLYLKKWIEKSPLNILIEKNILYGHPIDDSYRASLEASAEKRFRKLAASSAFGQYVDLLVQDDMEGIVSRLLLNYHGLQDNSFRYFVGRDVPESTTNLSTIIEPNLARGGRDAVADIVAILGMGAFYYRSLGEKLNTPYSPFCLRNAYCIYDDAKNVTDSPLDAISIAMDILKGKSLETYKSLSDVFPETIFEFTLPLIFTFVLKDVSRPNEILPKALEVRNSKAVANLRGQLTELSKSINSGNLLTSIEISKEITSNIENALFLSSSKTQSVSVELFGVKLSTPIDLLQGVARLIRLGQSKTFYNSLLSRLPTIWTLSREDIRRVFNIDTSKLNILQKIFFIRG